VRREVHERVARLKAAGVEPGLATVLVGDDPASRVYVGNKERACAEVGMRSHGHRLAATTTQAELLALVADLGSRADVHGAGSAFAHHDPHRHSPVLGMIEHRFHLDARKDSQVGHTPACSLQSTPREAHARIERKLTVDHAPIERL